MLDRTATLKIIDDAYDARRRGDKGALATYWASDAKYRLAGDGSLLAGMPVKPTNAVQATNDLIDRFKFEKVERLDALVDGNTASVHWRVTMVPPSGKSVTTELYDLWKFNPDGKIASLLQFGDTALLKSLI